MATILLAGVDVFFRGKLEGLLPDHHLTTTDSVDPPELVICDVARIDPEECIDCGACEPECPVEAIFPEDALPAKWEAFVKINYAYGDGADVINKLTDEYATEHNVQNEPLE